MQLQKMCEPLHPYYPTIGRILISLIFILAGYGKIQSAEAVQGTAAMLAQVGLPDAVWFVYLVALFELIAGAALLVGAFAHEVAYLLLGFTFLATLLYHSDFSGPSGQLQMIMFLKNLAIMGGLLLVAATGAGPLSVDEAMKKRSS